MTKKSHLMFPRVFLIFVVFFFFWATERKNGQKKQTNKKKINEKAKNRNWSECYQKSDEYLSQTSSIKHALLFQVSPESANLKYSPRVWEREGRTDKHFFLDAFSHLYKRVWPSVRPSVRPLHTSWIFEKFAKFEQNSIRNKKVCHLEDDSKTSTRAGSQNASVVRTLFDLFINRKQVRWTYGRTSGWTHQWTDKQDLIEMHNCI